FQVLAGNSVEVRVLSWAPNTTSRCMQMQRLFRFHRHISSRKKFSEKSMQPSMSTTQAAI
ncbi:MAG: hypothetical protein L0H10_13020, partial [Comamonas sp.]|nr:hypothetical protein [Comamonas sp.]